MRIHHSFSSRADLVLVTSDLPGSYATLFGPGGDSLPFREDLSTYSDAQNRYTWAFAYLRAFAERERFIFATSDRAVAGEVAGTNIQARDLDGEKVERDPSGKPLRIVIPEKVDAFKTVAEKSTRFTIVSSGPGKPMLSPPVRTIPGAPKISVATVSYNRPDLLRAAVESLRRQTDGSWEHLIFDDASTDPKVANVLAWAAEDPRVRVWRTEDNIDRPAARWNFLLDRACGRYFTVLDDDNEKLSEFVRAMSEELDRESHLDLVTCGWVVIRPDGERETNYHLNLSTCPSEIDRLSTCDGGATVYRREFFERVGYFSELLRTNEDWDWMRRAIHVGAYKNLNDCLATYRSHTDNRMMRSKELGSDCDVERVRSRTLAETIGVTIRRVDPSRLTRSQEDATGGILRGVGAIPWVTEGRDLAVVVSPFQMSPTDAASAVKGFPRAVSIHMEDPYALEANIERVRAMASVCPEVWVATNEIACSTAYGPYIGSRVIICPSLGADDSLPQPTAGKRDIDVLFCGYAYPSRRKFVDALLPHLRGVRVILVGDGWEGKPVENMPTQALDATYRLHGRARAVVCLHRTHGDCSDGPVAPRTVNRGFLEGYCGARVFIDDSRNHHAFDAGDVVFYGTPMNLASKLIDYLDGPRAPEADRFAARCAQIFTYRARMARILNCVRAPRYMAEIP